MRTIFKYTVQLNDELTLAIPAGAQLLCVQTQRGIPQLWAVVDTERPDAPRHFRWFGTGHSFDPGGEAAYIGTVQINDGALVFHLFEVAAPSGQ
jgi:hypothetical protein